MTLCSKFNSCGFIGSKAEKLPNLSELFIKRFCKEKYHECACFQVYKCIDDNQDSMNQRTLEELNALLLSLYPNETFRVKNIIPAGK